MNFSWAKTKSVPHFRRSVGADDMHKQEIEPALIASAKVGVDSLEQSCTIGARTNAIAQGLMRKKTFTRLFESFAGHQTRTRR